MKVYNTYIIEGANRYYDTTYFASNEGVAGIIALAVLLFLFTIVAPLLANNYRYSLRSADFYNQIGKSNKKVRFVNNFILLGAIIASFTAAYILGIIILAIKEIAPLSTGEFSEIVNSYYGTSEILYVPFFYNFIYFIPIYLILLIGTVVNYFISYFFISRANSTFNSIFTLIFGHIVLTLGVMTPLWYYNMSFRAAANFDINNVINLGHLLGTKCASFISVVSWCIYSCYFPLIGDYERQADAFKMANSSTGIALGISIASLVIFILMGLVGLRYFLKEDESSGELAGKPVGRDHYMMNIFHIFAGIFGLWYLALNNYTSTYSFGMFLHSCNPCCDCL